MRAGYAFKMAESSEWEELMSGEESVHENNTTLEDSSMILDDSERNEAETSMEVIIIVARHFLFTFYNVIL